MSKLQDRLRIVFCNRVDFCSGATQEGPHPCTPTIYRNAPQIITHLLFNNNKCITINVTEKYREEIQR